MTGEWVRVKGPKHTCDLPNYRDGARPSVTDRWRCECGNVYEVTGVWSGDQREPLEPGEYPQINWRKV